MIVGIARRRISRGIRIGLLAMVLAVLVLYVLPRLLDLFWQFHQLEPKIREEQLWEKPLRVFSEFVKII